MNTLLTPLKKLFSPPRFADEEKTQRIHTLWRIILISLAGSVIFGITSTLMRWGGVIPFASAVYALLALGCLWLMRQGWFDLPGILLPSVLLALVTFQTIRNHGPHDQAILIYPLVITFSWLLLSRRMALAFLILSLNSAFLVIYLEVNGFITPHIEGASEYSDIITFTVVFGSIALLVDSVTDNLRATLKRLQDNEARLRGLVENSPDFILEINRAGEILFINRLSEMYIGKNVRDVLPRDQLEYGLEMIERTFRSEQPVFAELRTAMPDGRIVWDAVRMGPIKQGDVVTSITVVMTDISIQKSAETALRESEARITDALVAGGVVPYINDYRIKRFTFISANVSRLTGYSAAEITPLILKDSVEEDHMWGPNANLSAAEARQRVLAGEPLEWRSDLRIRTATGESRWISDISTEILDEDGKTIGGIGILQDITERKRTESALRASEEQYQTFISIERRSHISF